MMAAGSLAADVFAAVSISFLFAVAFAYRGASAAHAPWPMDWGFNDRPLWTARRDVALFAFPSLMSLTLVILALASRGQGNEAAAFALRTIPALAACAIHWTYLRRAAAYVRPRRR